MSDGAYITSGAGQVLSPPAGPFTLGCKEPKMRRHPSHALSLTQADHAEMARLYAEERLTSEQVARRFGISKRFAQQKIRETGTRLRTLSEVKRKYTVNESAFDDHTDPEVQYFTGLLMTDGNVYHRSTSAIITLCLQRDDIDIVNRFRTFVATDRPIRIRPPRVLSGLPSAGCLCRDQAVLVVDSRGIAESLARYGVLPRKSKTAKASIVERSSDFWRGCIDGDGSIYITNPPGRRPRATIKFCGSPDLVGQFADFIAERLPGRRPKILKRYADHHCQCILNGRAAFEITRILYDSRRVAIQRKQRIADEIMSRPELFQTAWRPRSTPTQERS